jgi:hypothetical protein
LIIKWLEETIIGLDLCPFARKPFLEGKVLVKELPGQSPFEAQNQFLDALNFFQAQKNFETALLVYPDWEIPFPEFYEFSQDCEGLLIDMDLQDEFHLVAFHPEFCFEGLDPSDRANLVNSSPLPLIHILRFHDLEVLNLSGKEAEKMSFGNTKKLNTLNEAELRNHFPWKFTSSSRE